MDAHALLTSQGWRGTGNSLHPITNDIGLAKPLLVSRKDNTHGVGKKQHKTSDMWWMNAFDKSLQGLDTSKEGVVVQTVTGGGLDLVKRGGAKWILEKGGLYGSFVRGESLRGTITPEERGEVKIETLGEKKRKREGESKEERRARKAAKREKEKEKEKEKEDDLAVKDPVAVSAEEADKETETKEEKRARKAAKKAIQKQQVTADNDIQLKDADQDKVEETKQEHKARKAAKKAQRIQNLDSAEFSAVEVTDTKWIETKEEKRERKRLKKLKLMEEQTTTTSVEDLSESTKKKKRRKD